MYDKNGREKQSKVVIYGGKNEWFDHPLELINIILITHCAKKRENIRERVKF